LCAISFVNMNNVSKMANEITQINFQKAIPGNSIPTHIQALNKAQVTAIAEKSKDRLATVGEKRKLYVTSLEKLEKLEMEKEGKELLTKLKETAAAGKEGSIKLGKAIEEGNFDEDLDTYKNVCDAATEKIIGVVGELIKYQEDGVQAKYNLIMQNNRKVMFTLGVAGAVSIIL
jgi:hypothetical protein